MKSLQISKGFTLIELLIVLAMIGILATLLIANFIGVRQRSRDAQRKADLQKIQSAVERYRTDQGKFPVSNAASPCTMNGDYYGGGYQSLSPYKCNAPLSSADGKIVYINDMSCMPSTTCPYQYTSSDGLSYRLEACLENSGDTDPNIQADQNCASGKEYVLVNQ